MTSIAAALPEAISHKVPARPEQFVSIPVATILPQLGQGHVVMTAAELCECAPEYFSALRGHDELSITLPLGEIVKQISPAHFARRQQTSVEVPSEVLPVFAVDSKGVTLAKPAAPAIPSAQRAHPTNTTTTPMPAVAATAVPSPATAGRISMSPQALAALGGSKAAAPATPAAPALPAGYSAAPKPTPAPSPFPRTTPPAPPAAKKPASQLPKLTGELAIPLASVCGNWVDEVRSQLQEVDIAQAQILAPLELIEPAMKSGKVIFSWQEVAAWIQPPLAIAPTPKVGEMPVELPLKVIAPLFMAHARTGTQKRADVDETIPDLFADANGKANGSLHAQVPSTAPAALSAPTRQVKPSIPAPVPAEPAAPVESVAADSVIGSAAKRFSVKEIMANAARLPGVTGALLAMSDGLLVTCQAPAEVKGETIAAFLPQMFGRMNQYTKELALGPLEQLTLTVEGGQWHVIKAPNIYFAVLGKRGESLPLNMLAQVAAELSSQSK